MMTLGIGRTPGGKESEMKRAQETQARKKEGDPEGQAAPQSSKAEI